MTSDTLLTLRAAPDQQASVYNDYMPKATAIRQYYADTAISAKLTKLANAATASLLTLQDACNQAESAIRSRVATTDADLSEASVQKVQWALDHNLLVTDIAALLVSENDPDGLKALRLKLPWLVKAGSNGSTAAATQTRQAGRDLENLNSILDQYEDKLLTDQQKRLRDEVREVDISMVMLRQNFVVLLGFFEQQMLPGAVAGMFKRVERIWRWQGLPNDGQVKGSINLTDDFGGAAKAKGTPGVTSNAPYTPGALDTYIQQQKH